jgi:hypothetical protein
VGDLMHHVRDSFLSALVVIHVLRFSLELTLYILRSKI